MTFIPDKSIVTWVGSWIPGVGANPQESAGQVSTQLSQLGMKAVSITWTGDSFLNVGQDAIKFTIKVQTVGGTTYGSENDVQSIINHAVYEAVGQLPISSQITDVQLSRGDTSANVTTQLPACGTGFVESIKGFLGICSRPVQQVDSKPFSLSSITGSGVLWIALVVFGFVGAFALIGYSGALKRTL